MDIYVCGVEGRWIRWKRSGLLMESLMQRMNERVLNAKQKKKKKNSTILSHGRIQQAVGAFFLFFPCSPPRLTLH